jgi:hypothetical protein
MCGIVGAVSTRNIVPILVRGPEAAGVPRLRQLRRGRAPGRRAASGRAAPRAWPSSRPTWPTGISRRHRHRAHALGHARRAGGAQRAPALLGRPDVEAEHRLRRSRRRGRRRAVARIGLVHNGIIENHDELRRRTAGPRLRVCQPDRHRGHRAPGAQPVRRRPARRRAARAAAAARRLRHRRVLPRRAAPRGGRARRLAADRGRGRPRARTSWPATPWRWPA